MVEGIGSTIAVIVVVTQPVVAVTVEAGTWMYLLQNGIDWSIYLLSISALKTLSRLHEFGSVVRSDTRGLHKAGITANRRVRTMEGAIFDVRTWERKRCRNGRRITQIIYMP
jgi:hypothetical protein